MFIWISGRRQGFRRIAWWLRAPCQLAHQTARQKSAIDIAKDRNRKAASRTFGLAHRTRGLDQEPRQVSSGPNPAPRDGHEGHSIQDFDSVAQANNTLRQHSAINARRAIVSPCDVTQDLWILCCGLRIERDHLAPRVAFENRDHDLGAKAYLAADQAILRKPCRRPEIQINIRAEAPLVESKPDLLA